MIFLGKLYKDQKFQNSIKGIIIGHFTIDEYQIYNQDISSINKRIINLAIDRLKDQVEYFINGQAIILLFLNHLWLPLEIPLHHLSCTLYFSIRLKYSGVRPYHPSYCQLVGDHPRLGISSLI